MGLVVVFNPGETSLVVDQEGHVVEPHGWGVADAEYIEGALLTGQLMLTGDASSLKDLKEEDSNPAVIMAKKELEERLRLQKPAPKPKAAAEPTSDTAKQVRE